MSASNFLRVRRLGEHWPIAVVFALTAWIYLPVRGFDFVAYKDPIHVSANPEVAAGLSGAGLAWAFTTFRAANWHPLTWLAHMLDVELFGLDAGSHHLVSLALHLVNVLLLYAVLRRLRLGVALATGITSVFALHPLRVESVAWIAERKDVLSGTFFLLCLWLYANAVLHGGRRLWLVLCCALGLMVKPTLVCLPLVLLVLDKWPLERKEPLRARLREKLPLFLLAGASALVTLAAHARGGALQSFERLPLEVRVAHAPVALFGYVRRLFWPADLACYYPHPALLGEGPPEVWTPGAILALLGALALVAVAPTRRAWFTGGLGWTYVLLAPVIGIVQVGGEALADRYTYLALIGFSILVFIKLREHLGERGLLLFLVPLLVALGWSTQRTLSAWRDTTTLFHRALEAAPDNPVIATRLGTVLTETGSYEEARAHLERAIELAPRDPRPRTRLGLLLLLQEGPQPANAAFEAALTGTPDFTPAVVWSAATKPSSQEELRRALDSAQAAVNVDGGQPATLDALAAVQAALGDFAAAQETQRLALERSEPEARSARRRWLAHYERGLAPIDPMPAEDESGTNRGDSR
jgi:Flp pilus assembly protein TadD